MKKENKPKSTKNKREYTLQFKQDAVQMMHDGHKAKDIVKSLMVKSKSSCKKGEVECCKLSGILIL